jgi:hypothetical protein
MGKEGITSLPYEMAGWNDWVCGQSELSVKGSDQAKADVPNIRSLA